MQVYHPTIFEDFERIAEIYNAATKPFLSINSINECDEYRNLLTQTPLDFWELRHSRKFLCLKEKDIAIGFVCYYIKKDHIIWISSLYVDPAYQGLGFGTTLLKQLYAGNKNCTLAALETHAEAEWAIRFYTKNGYKVVNDIIQNSPYDEILNKPPVEGRPILARIISGD